MDYLIMFVLLFGVILLVSAPLRARRTPSDPAAAERTDERGGEERREQDQRQQEERSLQRIDLEAARDAKYREIRDAELDYQTGKLSDQDYQATDSTLRTEAIELLHALDALDAEDKRSADEAPPPTDDGEPH